MNMVPDTPLPMIRARAAGRDDLRAGTSLPILGCEQTINEDDPMRKFVSVLVLVLTVVSMSALGDIKSKQEISAEARSNAPHISSEELAAYLAEEKDFVLLDIRTEAEYEAGHIRGAQWLPRGKLEYSIQELVKDPDARIVLYCRTGGRSGLATATLADMGYTQVVDLDGGFKSWVELGNSFYNMHGENKVVSYQKEE
jgi:rhodanese-related sulfurtransferase